MPQTPRRRKPIARIRFHGHVASLGREAVAAIADEPVFDDHLRKPGATLIFRGIFAVSGQSRDKRRRVRFAAGLVGRVVKALEAKGWEVHGKYQTVEFDANEQLQQVSRPVRQACGQPRSLFKMPKLAERIRFIAELSPLATETHMVVVARNNAEAKKVAGMLGEATGRYVSSGFDQHRDYPWRHVKSACALSADAAGWDIVIFFDAELAITKTSIDFLGAGNSSIRIAFHTRDQHHLQEEERAVIEGLFGPIDVDRDFADVSVAWLRSRTGQQKRFTDTVQRKRSIIWKNDPRNRFIARAARSISELDFNALERLGLGKAAIDLLGSNPAEPPTVAIVVANAEQGGQLAHLLPGWRLETAGYTPPPGKRIRHDRVIMTLTHAGEELLATTAIIYAAGGRDWWLEHVCLGTTWGTDGTLIVDIADQHDEQSAEETACRAAQYRHLGYHEVSPGNPSPTWQEEPCQPPPETKANRSRPAKKGGIMI